MAAAWVPRVRWTAPSAAEVKQREIEHFRTHGKANFVMDSELDKMKELGLYREDDELLTVSDYEGFFIVLRKGNIVRLKFSAGNRETVFEEEKWMEKARGK